jgi:integrase
MGKRTNTAVWLPAQNRWRVNVQKNGRRRSFYSSTPGRAGQREANAKADAWLDEGIEQNGAKVADLWAGYLAAQQLRTSKANWVKVESFGRTRLLPPLGHKKIDAVTEQDLQTIIDKAYSEKLSKKTLRNYLGHINSFYKYCRMVKATTLRPESLTIPADARYKTHTILQPADIAVLFSVDTTEYRGKVVRDNLINAYRLAVLTGLRPGELRGLRWADLHGDRLQIAGAINQLNEHTKGKNENALRVIVLPPLALALLCEQRNDTMTEEYIFPIGSMQGFHRRWSKYSAVNGLPHTTLYEMRHTFVSICQQLPEGQIKSLVGHSASMDTFGVYGHELQGSAEATAQEINAIFTALLH